jgi:parallel beta-helix repeat protein
MDKRLVVILFFVSVLLEFQGLVFMVHRVEAFDYISIEPNGSVAGTDKIANIGNTMYTFTDDITSSTIIVKRSNIIIDGEGHTLGPGASGVAGFELDSLSNVTIKNTKIIEGFDSGIWIHASSCIVISGNSITKNRGGLFVDESDNNTFSENNLINNQLGIALIWSKYNVVVGNNITDNVSEGIASVWGANDNVIYHNRFVNNTPNAYVEDTRNIWDNGYPAGGNYWDDYLALYPNATEIGNSGIGDTPYVIDANNIDRYPFMTQNAIAEFPSFLIMSLVVITTLVSAIVYRRKRSI